MVLGNDGRARCPIRSVGESNPPVLANYRLNSTMSLLPRTDRSVTKKTTLDQQGLDGGVPDATPAERMAMVWPLTLTVWEFKEPNVVQPRLQRHVVRTRRGEG